MKQTIKTLSNTQYHYLIWVIIYALGIASIPSAASFYILSDLGGGLATSSYGVSLFILGEILTKPLALVLGEKIGKFKLLKICLWLSLGLNVALVCIPVYYVYLALRFLAGVALGPVFLISTSTIVGFGSQRKWLVFDLLLIGLMLITPVLAGSFGGIMAYQYNWRLGFIIYNLILVSLLYFLYPLFDQLETPCKKNNVDVVGIVTYFLGFGCLGFCLVTGLEIDGFRSLAFNIVFAVGCINLTFFAFWNFSQPYPIIRFSLFKNMKLVLNFLSTLFLYTFFFAMMTLISVWLHLQVNYSINWIALSLIGIILGPACLLIIFSKRGTPVGESLLPLSFFILAAIAFYISTFDANINFGRILITKLIAGITLAFALPTTVYMLQTAVSSPEDKSNAFSCWALFRVFGSIIGVSLFITIWEKRAYFYYQRLGGTLTHFSEKTTTVLDKLNDYNFTPLMKLEGLSEALSRQSYTLALDDCYFFMGWVLLGFGILSAITLWLQKSADAKNLAVKT